ncbi:MAG: SUMF1/EgtB/PvdO family nonheme iron enzyme [Crocinitomicaceae bacterium]
MKQFLFVLAIIGALSFTQKSKKFKGPENYVFIPSGAIEMEGEKYSCAAFWMSKHEVTNYEYRQFLKSLKDANRMDEYKTALPDTLEWSKIGGYMDQMANMYFWHPAYNNYPVVNVSKEGAEMYCQYVTEQYRTMYGNVIQNFRLPTQKEWMYAAASGKDNMRYAWDGLSTRDADGRFRANYFPIGDQNIQRTDEGILIVPDSLIRVDIVADNGFATVDCTAKGRSYAPNEFGLYNICGNVAELVADKDVAMGGHWQSMGYDIRIQSSEVFNSPNPFTGFRPVLTFIKQDN